ncbi:MAG: sugar phosphate isomerase/epimerase family protein [Planctomycetota bacterium]
MPPSELKDFSRLAIHTITTRPWSLEECIDHYQEAGVGGITVWRNVLEPLGAEAAGKRLAASDLEVVALVRGGFFPGASAKEREAAIEENKRCIDEAAAVGAPMVVLVCGAIPGMPLAEARRQITDGIAAVVPHAEANNVQLAIEPLHPMYAADRSAVNTMAQARAICKEIAHPFVGIAVDVYHLWWDPDLEAEIRLAGQMKTLFAFHICDWRVETRDLLNDRGLMGEGCIDIPTIRGWAEDAGFAGWNEVEIFSDEKWGMDQRQFVGDIKRAYLDHT